MEVFFFWIAHKKIISLTLILTPSLRSSISNLTEVLDFVLFEF
jgi:hypothetical protein